MIFCYISTKDTFISMYIERKYLYDTKIITLVRKKGIRL